MNKYLHLPSLTVKGFRGLKNLTIPKLGEATLLVGANGSGKTTVLESVRAFASKGSRSVLADILLKRDETEVVIDEDGETRVDPAWDALFHGRNPNSESVISIGQAACERLVVRMNPAASWNSEPPLAVSFRGREQEMASSRECESLGRGLPDGRDMARLWDNVALTDGESRAVESLNRIFGVDVERVAVVGEGSARQTMAKIKGTRSVPLLSLGDGASRVWPVVLALESARNGFLLLDEAENGIHHAIQRVFWKTVMLTARENNVQVIAATHSWDCVKGFALAASELGGARGLLYRIENDGGEARAVPYSEEGLKVAVEQGTEMR